MKIQTDQDKYQNEYMSSDQKRIGLIHLLGLPLLVWAFVLGVIFFTGSDRFQRINSAQEGIGGAPPTSTPTVSPVQIPGN